jgi:Fe-S cluster biogenesis protein NfuA
MNTSQEHLQRLLQERIVPELHLEGWQLEVIDWADHIARIRVNAAAGCCAGSVASVAALLEAELRRLLPDVQAIELIV